MEVAPARARAATVDLIIIVSPDQLRPGTLKSNTTPAVCYHPPHPGHSLRPSSLYLALSLPSLPP